MGGDGGGALILLDTHALLWLDLGQPELGRSAVGLSGLHRDPADRLIVATAMRHGAQLLTADERLLAWPGPLDRHDARS